MDDSQATEDLLFEVSTPLGFNVRVTLAYWKIIVTIKHPVMLGHESDVKESIVNPGEIRISRNDPAVYLFYKLQRKGRWLCAVIKRTNGDGFLVTTYPTDSIKEGEHIWPR